MSRTLDLIDLVANKVNTRFLWVTFQLESICRENTDKGILKALENLPKDLPTTYRRILRRLRNSGSTDPSMGKKLFGIVKAARRPLTLEELREATSIEPGNPTWDTARVVNDVTKLLGCCGSLVTVDEESSTVQFAHSSVKQYLETTPVRNDISEYHIATEGANVLMGEIVVTYLNLDVLQNMPTKVSDLPKMPITNEASVLIRASLPSQNFATSLARKLLKNRKTPGHDVGRDLERVACFKREQQMQPLEARSFFSYAQEHWLSHTESFRDTSMDVKKSTCYDLWTQLIKGHVPTVDLPWTSEDALALNPGFLGAVVRSHHPALVKYACSQLVSRKKTFLEIQKFVNSLPPYELTYKERAPRSYYDIVLFEAVSANDEDLVQLLLDKTPADANSHIIKNSSLLNMALRSGNLDIVKKLISHGADVNAREAGNISPLETAARSLFGVKAILLLLESGAARIPLPELFFYGIGRVLQEGYDLHDQKRREEEEEEDKEVAMRKSRIDAILEIKRRR